LIDLIIVEFDLIVDEVYLHYLNYPKKEKISKKKKEKYFLKNT
jgi:hypothetical protein